jgi:hypothetical protein
MAKIYNLDDYRESTFDHVSYLQKLQGMSKIDLLVEMSDFTEIWNSGEKISTNNKKRGIMLFTEIYNIAETPELRRMALEALQRLEKE